MTSNGAPSLIPLLQQPGWKRSVQKERIEPRLQQPVGGQSDVCLVCNKNESRYTCPRCEIPYCSLECYKQHGEEGDDGSSCTEGFYQDRVSSVLRMEQKDGAKEMQNILQRSHEAEQASDELSDLVSSDVLSEEELWAISDALEAGLDLSDADLDKILSPEAKRAFMEAIEGGALNEAVEQWHPWWMKELISRNGSDANPHSIEQQEALSSSEPSLDERLLAIISFSKLRPGMKPSTMLRFNLLEILYAVARTLRLYHGLSNAIASCQEASETLMASSSVLREDARFIAMEDAMVDCTTASTKALSENADCNAHWTILAEDVALLLLNRRHTAHALFDAMDILGEARKMLRESGDTEGASKLRLARKKLEFYLSWSRETDTLPLSGAEIREWIEEWKDSDGNVGCLRLPNIGAHPSHATDLRKNLPADQPEFLTEVSSARLK